MAQRSKKILNFFAPYRCACVYVSVFCLYLGLYLSSLIITEVEQ